ncbi:MAG TPA: folylpolyglutamate synthase/dihydrofolate synthase family protein [Gemmatimonadaceae bacterium]|nr:folylpolyglutamate synthase/dihydrofolate synthase family protein [Gemmatimonadaceae bacterium]
MDIGLTHPATYREALDALFARVSGGWKLGLDTTRALLASLGNPHEGLRVLHVGGTNGKGSVVSTLDALLRSQGLRVGRYTSPHLVDFRERIVVDGVPIGEDAVVDFIARWTPEVERLGATFFEATTCMAFDHFARADVDVVVLEVGLGGRLDATNVVTPKAAAVTSIGLDHQQYLGDTTDAIAVEKAGIFKRGVPAVIGEPDPVIRAQLASLATAAGSPRVMVIHDEWSLGDIAVDAGGTSFTLGAHGVERRLHTPLVGRYQASNTATAIAMLELAGGEYAKAAAGAGEALRNVAIPGRFQWCGNVIFDVAHNPAGTAVLCDTLSTLSPPRPVVCLLTVLRDKDWRAMMTTLAQHVDRFVLTAPPSVPLDRAWVLSEAVEYARANNWRAGADADFDRALDAARSGAATTLITGSFHTVGDAMSRLQVSPFAG